LKPEVIQRLLDLALKRNEHKLRITSGCRSGTEPHGAPTLASTVAHDGHNIVVVGQSDSDMVACIERLETIGGGIVVVCDGQVHAELALPVAGLLADEPFESVVDKMDAAHAALVTLGVEVDSPFMTLSFLALSVIPALKITDRGLIDVDRFEIVPLEAGGTRARSG